MGISAVTFLAITVTAGEWPRYRPSLAPSPFLYREVLQSMLGHPDSPRTSTAPSDTSLKPEPNTQITIILPIAVIK